MRKIFRFGLANSSDAFILVTALETILTLVYVVMDGTDFLTAGLHLSASSQEILIPPLVKWIVSLFKFSSTFILWAHLLKSVHPACLRFWILVGLCHDLVTPAWLIIQDILAQPMPDYPPLYRIVLLLSFRFYVYYFIYQFQKEMNGGSSLDSLANNPSSDEKSQRSRQSIEFEQQHQRKVRFGSITQEQQTQQSKSSSSEEIPDETASMEFGYLLTLNDFDGMRRLVKISLITEIIWNLYVLLIHEIRIGVLNSPTLAADSMSLISLKETVTLEMIWIRLGFVAIAAFGLIIIKLEPPRRIPIIIVSILYTLLVVTNLAYLIKVHNWRELYRQHLMVNLILTVFFIGAGVVMKACVGWLILKLGLVAGIVDENGFEVHPVTEEFRRGSGPQRRGSVELVFVVDHRSEEQAGHSQV